MQPKFFYTSDQQPSQPKYHVF